MNNVYSIIAVVLTSIFVFTHGASAELFQCAFLQEKYSSGKPNKAACAMSPEKVFSTKDYTPPKNEHCEVKPVYMFEDLEEVTIVLSKGTVSWIRTIALTEDAKPIQKKYELKQGASEEDANRQPIVQRREAFQIWAHRQTNEEVWIDEVTQKVLEPPKLVPQHSLMFGNANKLFHMYIPESTTEAIILEPAAIMGNSWVNIQFGKCKKLSSRP